MFGRKPFVTLKLDIGDPPVLPAGHKGIDRLPLELPRNRKIFPIDKPMGWLD
jgi:hypothetical protein